MENLTLLGIIYVIVGLVLSAIIFVALILLVFGLLLMMLGRKNSSYGYARYPMFVTCGSCKRYIDVASTECPTCGEPVGE